MKLYFMCSYAHKKLCHQPYTLNEMLLQFVFKVSRVLKSLADIMEKSEPTLNFLARNYYKSNIEV